MVSRMSYMQSKYHEDSDADDEYERSVIASPALVHDYESSPTESDPPSAEHTPTTFTHGINNSSPKSLITQWTVDQCAEYVSSLGLSQYADAFLDEAITGDALIAILQPDLKEMGVTSLGHRLTILKGVYDLKKRQNIPVEPDHFVPLSAETNTHDGAPSQDDIARIIRIIKERDERIHTAENELRILREDLNRISDENRRLREDILPLARAAKNNTQPLPDPSLENGGGLSRKFSHKKIYIGGNPKNPSPTVVDRSNVGDTSTLDPSAAAMLASNHLTAQMRDDKSSPQFAQPSPTSPAYAPAASRSRHTLDDHGIGTWNSNASYASTVVPDARSRYRSADPGDPPNSGDSIRGTVTPSLASASLTRNPLDTATINATLGTPSTNGPSSAGGGPAPSSASIGPSSSARSDAGGSSNPQVEIFKSFRVSIDDPCHKVLPVALKKYNITADWRQYALYIVHGDQERCLGLNERPLILFKQLDKEGRKPMFMLRKHAQPIEGHVNTIGHGGSASQAMGMMPGQVPGGVL